MDADRHVLRLDTRNATDSSTPHSTFFNIDLNVAAARVHYITLESVCFVHGRAPINSNNDTVAWKEHVVVIETGVNDVFKWVETGGPTSRSHTITAGTYTGAAMATYLQANLTNITTVTFSSSTFLFTFTFAGTVIFVSAANTAASTLGVTDFSTSGTVLTSQVALGYTNYSLTIPDGVYTGSELAAYLQTNMTTTGGSYTVTFSDITQKLTLVGTVAWTWLSTCTAIAVLGFTSIPTATTTLTSDSLVRLDGSEYVDVLVSFLEGNRVFSSNSFSTCIARIDLPAFGELVAWRAYTQLVLPVSVDNFRSMNIRLVDSDGNAYVLPSSCPVQYEFWTS